VCIGKTHRLQTLAWLTQYTLAIYDQPQSSAVYNFGCVCLYVYLSDDNFWKLWRKKFIFAHPAYLQRIRVKFIHECYRVKVKVTGAKDRKPVFPQCKTSIAHNSGCIKDRATWLVCINNLCRTLEMMQYAGHYSFVKWTNKAKLCNRLNNHCNIQMPNATVQVNRAGADHPQIPRPGGLTGVKRPYQGWKGLIWYSKALCVGLKEWLQGETAR